jgi:hypothetical protein
MDSVPGRLNQVTFDIQNFGVYRGQCSEFCGTGHGFMPIVIEACSLPDFYNFIFKKSFEMKVGGVDLEFLRQMSSSFREFFNDFKPNRYPKVDLSSLDTELSLKSSALRTK